jgi:hypothetical protein
MATIIKGHKISWFVYAGSERIPSTKSMRGTWGYDATCECGWDSKTGGATATAVGRMVNDHKWDVQNAAPVAATIKITIVSPAGDPEVHKAGCAHLNRQNKRSDVSYTIEVSSAQEAANDFWADFVESGEMSEEEALANTSFAPCVKELKS